MDTVNQAQVAAAVRAMADTAIRNEAYFSQLDSVMGDADFGASLAGGFGAVLKSWDSFDPSSIGSFLLGCSTVIVGNTGGCSGPIWGTLFMRAGMAFKGKSEINLDDIISALKSAMEGIMKRGGAEFGDKTLLDALHAIARALDAGKAAGLPLKEIFRTATGAAVDAREATKQWVARRGRQSFTGDRSVGTYDPGIVAVGEMAKAIVEALG